MILNLQHIYKDYQQDKFVVPVLKDINFQVEEGEYVAIMGPSGSGKTTLMNIIGCLDKATSGIYELADEDVSRLKDKQLSNLRLNRIGFVFQSFHLMPRQSAWENVALPLTYAGIKKKQRKEMATQALERVGLGERVDFKPTQLSGGQKQRVAIARAMVNNPSLLLADEPTGALDSKSGKQVMELFQKLNDEGVTIVMITHDAKIAAHAKRILYIIDGVITTTPPQETPDEEIQENPSVLLSKEDEILPELDKNIIAGQTEQELTNETDSEQLAVQESEEPANEQPILHQTKVPRPPRKLKTLFGRRKQESSQETDTTMEPEKKETDA